MDEQTHAQKLIDKTKAVAFTNSIHSLSPPVANQIDDKTSIAIVRALESEPIIKETIMDFLGMMEDPITKELIRFREPVMNKKGIGSLIAVLRRIAREYEFSNIHEDEIGVRIKMLFRWNFPAYTVYADEYDLKKEDFNLVKTAIFTNIDGILHKAKGGGHRNVVRGTYSEDTLGKIMQGNEQIKQQQQNSGFGNALSQLNPFKKR